MYPSCMYRLGRERPGCCLPSSFDLWTDAGHQMLPFRFRLLSELRGGLPSESGAAASVEKFSVRFPESAAVH